MRVSPGQMAAVQHWDEAFDAQGELRRPYRRVWSVVDELTPAEQRSALRQSREAFGGDNALHWVPRLLSTKEYAFLKRGVEQRATVLRMFLQDHYSGRKSYTKVISAERVDAIIARNGEAQYAGQVRPEAIAFPYGPDIMRGPNGRFYVIEDNPGYVGGPGDIILARRALLTMHPQLRDALQPVDDPKRYFELLLARARERAVPPDGAIIHYTLPPYADKEDERQNAIWRDLGVDVVTTRTKNRLEVDEQGVFVKLPDGGRRRVGFMFIGSEFQWLPEAVRRAVLDGKVATNYVPGVDFVGDKELKGYVDKLTRHYLGQPPVLKSIPVRTFTRRGAGGKTVLDAEKLDRMFDKRQWDRFVFKIVDGRGGTGVHIGPKMTAADADKLRRQIRAKPESWVYEPFFPLSVLDGHIVDLRPLATVDPASVVVSPTPFARGVALEGNGKVNLSSKGREFAAAVVEP